MCLFSLDFNAACLDLLAWASRPPAEHARAVSEINSKIQKTYNQSAEQGDIDLQSTVIPIILTASRTSQTATLAIRTDDPKCAGHPDAAPWSFYASK